MGKGHMEGVAPFIRIFNILGIFQNTVTGNELKRSVWWTRLIFLLWFILYFSYATFFSTTAFILTETTPAEKLDDISDLLIFVSVLLDMLVTYLSQDLFVKFFKTIMQYDKEVAKMRYARKDSFRFCWTYWVFGLLVIFVIVIISLQDVPEILIYPSLLQKFIVKVVVILVQLCCSFKLIVFMHLLLQRFRHFNNIASNICWTGMLYNSTTPSIQNVKLFHAILSNAVDYLNQIYGTILLIWVSGLIINMLILTFEVAVETTASIVIAAGFYTMQILSLCGISHYTIQEANRVSISITSNTFYLLPPGKTLDKIEVMMYFLHNRVSFTATGYFSVDYTLMQAIVSTIATYFMVLIQSI